MEGTLLKWTNYYNGWQPRYFLLDKQGVLSYYKSKELVDQGCKGSCAVAACQLKVHGNDCCRFDLIIPGEQFFCLKAKNQSERQKWLLAIGTLRGDEKHFSKTGNSSTERKHSTSNQNSIDHEMKMKIQELRLYETVLTQGIHNVKSLANDGPIVDVEKLDQSTSMLSVTCDAFIHTLNECLQMAEGNDSSSASSFNFNRVGSTSENEQIRHENNLVDGSNSSTVDFSLQSSCRTFFSDISPIILSIDSIQFDRVYSEDFLIVSDGYLRFFEKFKNPTFIPLRSEIQSNVSKVRRKFETDQNKFQYLSSIIQHEIHLDQHKQKNSATDAILWLKRTFQFVASFLEHFGQQTTTVEDALNTAYSQTLKSFHGWITRAMFSIAFRSSPFNEDFLESLQSEYQEEKPEENIFRQQIFRQMIEHSRILKRFADKITDFYVEHGIDSNETIG